MQRITSAPWRWTDFRVQENNDPRVDHELTPCVLDNYYTFLPYEDESDVPEIMNIDYGSELCSADESLGFMGFDYWGFYDNETRFRASGWGGTLEPGEILTLSNSAFKVLFTYQDSAIVRKTEITLAH